MTSITTFAYGLTVRAIDLVGAAAAWPRLEPVFHFFDLVYLRRKRGSLAGSSASVVVPVEVWERVKQNLVDMEIEDAVDRIARGVLKHEEHEKGDTGRYSWDRFLEVGRECPDCDDRRYDYMRDLIDGEHDFDERINDLVSTFGLAHPLDRFMRLDFDSSADDDSLALISIPQRYRNTALVSASGSASTFSVNSPNEYGIHMHAVVEVDLSLPSDPDLRFIRFIRTFNLKVFDTTQISQAVTTPQAAAAAGKGTPKDWMMRVLMADEIEIGIKVARVIKPQWKLYNVVLDKVDH